ncbi:MAG: hypothetical protein IIW18_00965, partial [Oscillospiraceae bacterium]|nr:hypothetical protein [Oscillospiraceae bacterium]
KSASAKSKKVQMMDLNSREVIKTFSSVSEAARELGISSGNISAVCRDNGRKQAGGYAWKYFE